MAKRVTIQSIAREVGLSHSTVSLVLNDRGDELGIKPETQQRVLEVAKRLHYQPNLMARGLRGLRTGAVGMLWSLGGPHRSSEVVRNFAIRVRARDHTCLITHHMSDIKITLKGLQDFKRRGVDAVVIEASSAIRQDPGILEWCQKFDAALMVMTQQQELPVDTIWYDRTDAFRAIARHLVQAGRQRPALILPLASNASKAHAFLDELEQLGIPPCPHRVIDTQPRVEQGRTGDWQMPLAAAWEKANQAGQPQPAFDAVVCSTDEGAGWVMQWLRQQNLRIPEDVAVVGFNNSNLADMMHPPLASVERQSDQLAALIEKMVFARLDQPKLPRQTARLNMTFVPRESAGSTSMGREDATHRPLATHS